MSGEQVRLLLTGPVVVAILVSFLAVTALVAGAAGRLGRLASLGARAVARLSHGRVGLLLWGLAAGLFAVLAAAVLFATKVLALLGLFVLLLGLALAGLGLGVSAAQAGRALAAVLGRPGAPPLLALGVGLTLFFLAAFLPVAGWLLVTMAMLSGVGATLEALVRRG